MTIIHSASFAELDAATLYALLRLRTDVFVVEQQCAYPELDGRDLEAATVHLWTEDDRGPISYLRILTEPAALKLGRVVTRVDARARGHGGRLVAVALARTEGDVVIDAQSRLRRWYEQFGFVADGPEFTEDGVDHLPMRLVRGPSADGDG